MVISMDEASRGSEGTKGSRPGSVKVEEKEEVEGDSEPASSDKKQTDSETSERTKEQISNQLDEPKG